MATTIVTSRSATIDPIKHGQSLGGLMAMLGIHRCMPLLHGAQGCSAFAKSLLTRHFREPIPVQTTALTQSSAIFGATDSLITAIETIKNLHDPDVIGILTTGPTETSGEDLAGVLHPYQQAAALGDRPAIVWASTPDYRAGLSEGWSAALRSLVTTPLGEAPSGRDDTTVAIPVGLSFNAADLDEITSLVRSFGLHPILVPNVARSIDGHLADKWSPLTTGGTTLGQLCSLPAAGSVISLGSTAAQAGAALAARSGAPVSHYDHCGGLVASDALIRHLITMGTKPVSEEIRHWRSRLADGLLDSHFVLGGCRVAIAGEPEYLATIAAILAEVGATIVTAISPTPDAVLDQVPCDEVVVGDLADLEERAKEAQAELVIASSHARAVAERINAAFLVYGFPIYDRLGAQLRGCVGYRGSLRFLFEAANRLLDYQGERS